MWKSMKTELSGKDVGVKFSVIVEPFHPWSFTAAVGAQTAAAHGGADAFFSFAEATWENGHEFVQNWGDDHYPLANLTETAVVAKMAAFAQEKAGVPNEVFYAGMTNRSTAGGVNPWAVAREDWKRAVARGAASSPWYFVNGVPYFAASDSAHVAPDDWKAMIDKLVALA